MTGINSNAGWCWYQNDRAVVDRKGDHHDGAALRSRPDGGYLAMFTGYNYGPGFYIGPEGEEDFEPARFYWPPQNPVGREYSNGYFKFVSNGRDRIDFIATEATQTIACFMPFSKKMAGGLPSLHGWAPAWTQLTSGSKRDNLRPQIAVIDERTAYLLWLHGSYRHQSDYDQALVAAYSRPDRGREPA
jgi:hypothetical protein